MDIPENWIHSPGIFPYPGNGDNRLIVVVLEHQRRRSEEVYYY